MAMLWTSAASYQGSLRRIITKPHFFASRHIVSGNTRLRWRFSFQCLYQLPAEASPLLRPLGTNLCSVCHRITPRTFASTRRSCWKCGVETKDTELFFCECGVVQSPAANATYYELFGIPVSFDLDLKDLSTKYKELQWKLHPDKFALNSETEREHAALQSAQVNKAYSTLQQPLGRAQYLLALQGRAVAEANTQAEPEFLMAVMELNESVDAARTVQDMEPLRAAINKHISQLQTQLSAAFSAGDLDSAMDTVLRYKYYHSIDEKIKTFYRKHMN